MNKINRVIGRAVFSLIASGKDVDKNSILELLKQSEKQAGNGMKNVYAEAIRLVTGRATDRIG